MLKTGDRAIRCGVDVGSSPIHRRAIAGQENWFVHLFLRRTVTLSSHPIWHIIHNPLLVAKSWSLIAINAPVPHAYRGCAGGAEAMCVKPK